MYSIVKILLISELFIFGHGQKLCNFSETVKTNTSSFIQNFSTSKCMRVSALGFLPSSKVVIDECSYWNQASPDQKFTIVSNSLNKTMIKTDAGKGESYCLTTTKHGILQNDLCQSQNFDQNWTFKPVTSAGGQKGWFLIEQYSSKKCLIPQSRKTGAGIQLLPCNSYQTEQIWKVCSV